MQQVTTTDSSTLCCKKAVNGQPLQLASRRMVLQLASYGVCALWAAPVRLGQAQAQALPSDDIALSGAPAQVQLLTDDGSVLLSADMPWTLPSVVLQALMQGIPVQFVAEADVVRPRWYWRNQMLLQARRYWRLSYQPLTRRWRLYMGNVPFEGQGLGVALAQTYESLAEALQAMQRVVRWRLGDRAPLPQQGRAWLDLRFRIDLSHFPRPLQIGMLGRADWNLLVVQQVQIDWEALP